MKRLLDRLRAQPPGRSEFDWNLGQIIAAKSKVVPRFGPAFSAQNMANLTRETFLVFVQFENNCHWHGLDRSADVITSDMNRLRKALALLVDEGMPIGDRLERLRPRGGKGMVPYLGPAILTAVLRVVFPDSYGVLNNKLKEAMTALGIWPHNLRDDSLADQYEAVNPILLELARELGIDLWTLDYLWWYVASSSLNRAGPDRA